jgi:shikimate dehydrogenase
MELLDWIEPKAQEIGAVNTIVIDNDRLLGYNTDASGLIEPLLKHRPTLSRQRVAVIGAGGVARTAVWAMKLQGAEVTLFARNPQKASPLAQGFEVSCESLAGALFDGYDIVINATPLGSGQFLYETPAISDQLAGAGLVYDLIYNPIETRFLKEAREAGCQTLGGLQMLVAQAAIQFELWTGKKPSAALMYDSAAAALRQ